MPIHTQVRSSSNFMNTDNNKVFSVLVTFDQPETENNAFTEKWPLRMAFFLLLQSEQTPEAKKSHITQKTYCMINCWVKKRLIHILINNNCGVWKSIKILNNPALCSLLSELQTLDSEFRFKSLPQFKSFCYINVQFRTKATISKITNPNHIAYLFVQSAGKHN